jgi:hypothetical protein
VAGNAGQTNALHGLFLPNIQPQALRQQSISFISLPAVFSSVVEKT